MAQKIFIDLDGTILNCYDKVYMAYYDFILSYGETPISQKRFWDLRRRGNSFLEILISSDARHLKTIFEKEFSSLIENFNYLELDKVGNEIKQILGQLKGEYKIYLATLRKNEDTLMWQLKKEGLIDFFDDIYFGAKTKFNLLKNIPEVQGSFLIGDTREDVKAGRKLKMKTVAVTSGLESEDILKKSHPHFIIKDLTQIYEIFRP